ncbi:MAG: 50S ribosomal protein L5 [Chloroflexota bacterium]|nr:50S ribosomal protein L5 [Chloroflexota bacterium]
MPRAARLKKKEEAPGAGEAPQAPPQPQKSPAPRLKQRYLEEIVPALMKDFQYTNKMQVPHLSKVVLNIGLGEAILNAKAMEGAAADFTAITGQHPVITRAKKSISAFKLREGMAIGMMVTLRGNRMYDFYDKLVNITLPRIRDFRGVPRNSFDGRGNYSLGIKEQTVFPEVEYDKVDRVRGLEVTIVTNARTDEEARRLLELLGLPFARS